MVRLLRAWLADPRVRTLNVDSVDFTLAHGQVLQSKAILRYLFAGFYRQCRAMDLRYFGDCPGQRLEIGSGAGFMKRVYPDLITSDVKRLAYVDLVLRAEQMPLADGSLRAVYAVNVFHHLSDVRAFLRELLRVLHLGGGAVLIEPYHGPAARLLFKTLHTSEGFDPYVPCWEGAACGPFAGANQASSYVVFRRDRAQFDREFPDLDVAADIPHTQLLYLASGGVNFRQLVPDSFTPLVAAVERVLAPLNPWIALQHTIVLRKRSSRGIG